MAQMTTDALYKHRLQWKLKSLECLHSLCSQPLEFSVREPLTNTQMQVKTVETMLVLGVLMDQSGSITTTLQHRQEGAGRCYHKYRNLLCNSAGSFKDRLLCYCQTVRVAMCYNSGGWHVNAQLLKDLLTWETQTLREIFNMKWSPVDSHFSFNSRSSQKFDGGSRY